MTAFAQDSGAPVRAGDILAGKQLDDARRTLPAAEAVTYLLQAREAIAEAHAAGMVLAGGRLHP